MNKRRRGEKVEQSVAAYLQQHGYRLLESNYRCPRGEIDLVAMEGNRLVFVEVRSRRSNRYGTPEESVNYLKQQRLILVARHYLAEKKPHCDGIRFDVVAVDTGPGSKIKDIRLHKDAFRPG